MDSQKQNILVLPDLFPKDEGDWLGVFVVDYIKAILPHANPWVFYSRLTGANQDIKKDSFGNSFDVYRWNFKPRMSPFLKPFFYLLWFSKSVNQVLSLKREVDLIHAHGAILNGTIAYLLSKKLKVPFVISEHTGPFSKIADSFVNKRWARFILNRADKIFAVSNHLKSEMVEMGIKEELIKVSFNPVDTSIFKLKNEVARHKNMLFVSRLEPFKGGLRTLKAFHEFTSKTAGWHLTICGEGYEKDAIVNYITNSKLEECVTVKGVLTKPEFAIELNTAAFLVFPSLHESFGLVPVEAMTCGLPIITTNATAMPEYVNKQNGILLNTASVTEISEAMDSMVNSLTKYNSKEISEGMQERFGIEQFGEWLMKEYELTINKLQR